MATILSDNLRLAIQVGLDEGLGRLGWYRYFSKRSSDWGPSTLWTWMYRNATGPAGLFLDSQIRVVVGGSGLRLKWAAGLRSASLEETLDLPNSWLASFREKDWPVSYSIRVKVHGLDLDESNVAACVDETTRFIRDDAEPWAKGYTPDSLGETLHAADDVLAGALLAAYNRQSEALEFLRDYLSRRPDVPHLAAQRQFAQTLMTKIQSRCHDGSQGNR